MIGVSLKPLSLRHGLLAAARNSPSALHFFGFVAELRTDEIMVSQIAPRPSTCLCNSAVHATNHDAPQDLTVQDAAMFSCSHVRYCFQVFSFFECLSFSANFLSCKQLSFMCRGHLRRGRVRCQRRHLSIACDISSGRRTDVPAKRWAPVPARLANLTWSSQRQVFRFCRFAAVLHT